MPSILRGCCGSFPTFSVNYDHQSSPQPYPVIDPLVYYTRGVAVSQGPPGYDLSYFCCISPIASAPNRSGSPSGKEIPTISDGDAFVRSNWPSPSHSRPSSPIFYSPHPSVRISSVDESRPTSSYPSPPVAVANYSQDSMRPTTTTLIATPVNHHVRSKRQAESAILATTHLLQGCLVLTPNHAVSCSVPAIGCQVPSPQLGGFAGEVLSNCAEPNNSEEGKEDVSVNCFQPEVEADHFQCNSMTPPSPAPSDPALGLSQQPVPSYGFCFNVEDCTSPPPASARGTPTKELRGGPARQFVTPAPQLRSSVCEIPSRLHPSPSYSSNLGRNLGVPNQRMLRTDSKLPAVDMTSHFRGAQREHALSIHDLNFIPLRTPRINELIRGNI